MSTGTPRSSSLNLPGILARLCALLACGGLILMVWLIVTGMPVEYFDGALRMKNLRKPFQLTLILALLAFLIPGNRLQRLEDGFQKLSDAFDKGRGALILFTLFAPLLVWQQITEYLSLQVNFIPFGFYDYMFHFLEQGKITYTGLLHQYYHTNYILIALYPLWKIFQSSMFLTVVYGILAALCVFPLYALAKKRFGESLTPFAIVLLFCNYKYLQNILQMNFAVEIFYPLLIFTALYAALANRWVLYYVAFILGLTVKEDSFMYFAALGGMLFLMGIFKSHWIARKDRDRLIVHGFISVLLALVYFGLLLKVLIPWTGSTIMEGSMRNYEKSGGSISEICVMLLRNPAHFFTIFFGSAEKLETWGKLLGKLFFIPFLTPTVLVLLAPLFPLFLRETGRDADFVNLHFHYAGAVIPFMFIVLTFGLGNLRDLIPGKWKRPALAAIVFLLLVVNGGYYRAQKVTQEDLDSIAWARMLPPDANVVTSGHLLPYIGYRDLNYYFAQPWEKPDHPYHHAFSNADYYLIDLHVNPWPMTRDYLEDKVKALRDNPLYLLASEDEGKRYLFKRYDLRRQEKKPL